MGPSLIDLAPSFHQAVTKWPDANNLKQHYDDLVSTYESNGSSLIELVKSFFEMVCITVVEELGAEPPVRAAPTTSDIFNSVKKALKIEAHREVSGLIEIIRGFNNITDGLDALRRYSGSVAHGKDAFIETVSKRSLRTYILAADSLISLILDLYEGFEPDLLRTREPLERFEHLNRKVDEYVSLKSEIDPNTGMLIIKGFTDIGSLGNFEMNITPSALLYELNRQAYRDIVVALKTSNVSDGFIEEDSLAFNSILDEPISAVGGVLDEIIPEFIITSSYEGDLREYYSELVSFLVKLNGKEEDVIKLESLGATLLTAIRPNLVVDWRNREVVKSQIRLIIKKIFREMNINNLSHEEILDWLLLHLPAKI